MIETQWGPAAPAQAAEKRSSLSVEHGLYALFVVVAFALRFINLGVAPLLPLEAAQSWPAWLAATGTSVAGSPAPASALYYGLQSLLFFMVGANDLLARLLPALVGTALVLLPWWWRDWLGRSGALLVALLLAVDPWLTALARTSDSTGLTTFLGLLALTALWRWGAGAPAVADDHAVEQAQAEQARVRQGWERVLAVALALLLVSGPQAWSWLPVLGAFAWVYGRRLRPQRATAIWFGAALVLGGSGFLARPEALGAVGTSLTQWLAQWGGDFVRGGEPFRLGAVWPLQRLLLDQLLLAVFGSVGFVLLARGRGVPGAQRLALFLGLWLAWGIMLAMLPGRSPFVLPMVGLPLALAAGVAIAYLLELPLRDVSGVEVAVVLGVAAVLVIAGSIWLAMMVESLAYDTRLVITAALLVGLIVLIWVVFGFWAGAQVAGKLGGLFFAGLLLLVTIRSGWLLNHLGGQMEPNGFFPVVTLPEARLLPLDVQRISSLRNNDPYETPLQVVTAGQPPDPLVGWLLRDMRRLVWVPAPGAAAAVTDPTQITPGARPLVVAPFGLEQDRGLEGLIGARYPLTMRWEPALLPALPETVDMAGQGLPPEELARLRADQAWTQATRPQLEWLLYRTVRNAPVVDGVTLWAAP